MNYFLFFTSFIVIIIISHLIIKPIKCEKCGDYLKLEDITINNEEDNVFYLCKNCKTKIKKDEKD